MNPHDSPPAAPQTGFRLTRQGLAYADLQPVRQALGEFLQSQGVSEAAAGQAKLMVTEILSNLVKHPPRKAEFVEVQADITPESIHLCVVDDSSPFANFDAKCKEILTAPHTLVSGAETGFGLRLIFSLGRDVTYAGASQHRGLNRFSLFLPHDAQDTRPKIFLIDDDPVSLNFHAIMLEKRYRVLMYGTARDALEAFVRERPAAVISDLVMPDMDGISLRKALGEIEGGHTTPFIFPSGKSAEESSAYINQLGVDDFLSKPVSATKLRSVLARLLQRSQQVRHALQSQFHQDITELLKPSLPAHFGAWTFAMRHRPAEAGGGDFVFHQAGQGQLTAALIDVMGHGRQAKFFSYVYSGYLRSVFNIYGGMLDASHFLRHLARAVTGDPLLERTMMTCQCFQFFEGGAFKVASAGHPAPILMHKRHAALMDVEGPMPGLVGDFAYEMKTFQVSCGDKIIFMTDGFLEAFDYKGRAATAIMEKINTAPVDSPEALAEFLWQAFLERQETQGLRHDDATVIIAAYGEKA